MTKVVFVAVDVICCACDNDDVSSKKQWSINDIATIMVVDDGCLVICLVCVLDFFPGETSAHILCAPQYGSLAFRVSTKVFMFNCCRTTLDPSIRVVYQVYY